MNQYNLTQVPTSDKAYEKHISRVAKLRDTTRELATTFNCGHCRYWALESTAETTVPTPFSGVNLNSLGKCSKQKISTHGAQICSLFDSNWKNTMKTPVDIKRARANWGPKSQNPIF